jgi:hypothetical protein
VRHVLRLGRQRAELWTQEANGLVCTAHQFLEEQTAAALSDAIVGLFSQSESAVAIAQADIDVALESAWLPVVPLEVGTSLWSSSQVTALLEHRLAQTYVSESDVAGSWSLRLDHEPGDAHGIGYALAPSVGQAMARASTATGYRWRSVQPAFAWGWQEFSAHRRRAVRRDGMDCWVWVEHDRALVALMRRGRIVALHPGAAMPRDGAELLHVAHREAMRFGMDTGIVKVVLAGWDAALHGRAQGCAVCLTAAAPPPVT